MTEGEYNKQTANHGPTVCVIKYYVYVKQRDNNLCIKFWLHNLGYLIFFMFNVWPFTHKASLYIDSKAFDLTHLDYLGTSFDLLKTSVQLWGPFCHPRTCGHCSGSPDKCIYNTISYPWMAFRFPFTNPLEVIDMKLIRVNLLNIFSFVLKLAYEWNIMNGFIISDKNNNQDEKCSDCNGINYKLSNMQIPSLC